MLLRTARQIADDWAVQSQLRARRNAMVAATILAERSAEAREVQEFLATRSATKASDAHPPVARRA